MLESSNPGTPTAVTWLGANCPKGLVLPPSEPFVFPIPARMPPEPPVRPPKASPTECSNPVPPAKRPPP